MSRRRREDEEGDAKTRTPRNEDAKTRILRRESKDGNIET